MRHELIGQRIGVIDATHRDLIGLHGLVIDETRNTLLIESGDAVKRIIKHTVMLQIGDRVIKGADIAHAPEDRTKKSKSTVKKQWHR